MAQIASNDAPSATILKPRFARTSDLAKVIGCSNSEAKRIVARGDISVVRHPEHPRMLLIPIDAIEQYVERLDSLRTQPRLLKTQK